MNELVIRRKEETEHVERNETDGEKERNFKNKHI